MLEKAAQTLRIDSTSDLLAKIGSADISSRDVVQAVYPDLPAQKEPDVESRRAVVGLKHGQGFERAPCCQPLPGERIVGLSRPGHGVQIHSIDCEALGRSDNEGREWLDLHWAEGKHPAEYTVTLDLTIGNDAGVLGYVCTLIGEREANISDLEFIDRKPDFYRLKMDIDVSDAEHLHSTMSVLAAESNVASVERHRDPDLDFIQAGAAE